MTLRCIDDFLRIYPPQDVYPAYAVIRALTNLFTTCSSNGVIHILEILSDSLSHWVSAEGSMISDEHYEEIVRVAIISSTFHTADVR